ncbi:NAD(P)-dependent oxidoreductase [uncultured Amnibacterium sp.]|uniref:NAD(P)-dependent oxidoreductase n=1 Tax=uncultured Amnibacterium sp. TaxID=1631851 RepID=UPI0035C9EBA9
MARIAVLGGTGYTGEHVVREAASRGHHVTAYSRSAPAEPVAGVQYVQASFLEEGAIAAAVAGQDVVVEALSPRGELAGRLDGLVSDAGRLAAEQGARLVVVGGWSALRIEEGGPRAVEGDVPEQFRPEAEEMVRALEWLERDAPDALDWVYISPAQVYGAFAPGEATGAYRVGGDVALTAEGGPSTLSGPDLALAIVDEIGRPGRTGHINVAS